MTRQDQQKHILFVITQGHWGGAQRYVRDLATSLPKTNDITVAVGEPNGEQDLQNQMSTIQLTHLRRAISPLHDIRAILELRTLFKQQQPDIIHLNSSKAGILGSLAAIGLKKTAIVYTAHGWVFLEPLSPVRKTLYRLLERITAPLKDAIIVLSDRDKQSGVDIGISSKKMHAIPLGIPPVSYLNRTAARDALCAQTAIEKQHTWFGIIANCYKTKGLDILVDAVATIPEPDRSHMQFIILGDGPERNALEAQVTEQGITNIHFLGFIPDAARYLSAFDTFVLPSRKEGLPYTILEAKQAGLPIIATDVGGVSSVLDDRDQRIRPEDPDALAQAIIQNTNTASVEAVPVHNRFTLEPMVHSTSQLYQWLHQAP